MTTRKRSWEAASRTFVCNDQTRSPNLNPSQQCRTTQHKLIDLRTSSPRTVGSDLEKRPPILRDTYRMHPRAEIRRRSHVDQVNQRALIDANRRPTNANPSEPPSTSAAAASDVSSGEATLRGHDRRGTFRRLLDDDAARSPQTMGTNKRRKIDYHQGGKGGETKLLRRRESREHRDIHYCIGRGEPVAGRIISQPTNADEVSWKHLSAEERTQFSRAVGTQWQGVPE